MIIDSSNEAELNSEMNNVYFYVSQKFDFAHNTIEETQETIESLIEFCKKSSVQSVLFEKLTLVEWFTAVDVMQNCTNALDTNTNILNRELEDFETIMDLSAGNVNEMFLQYAEKAVEVFISVQIGTADHKRKIQELGEILKDLARSEEN